MVVEMNEALSQPALLLRGFAMDFLTCHDVARARTIMSHEYTLHIGGHVFSGRDDQYVPATGAQLDLFPGLVVTVHDTVLAPGWAAMRFTEHGVAAKPPGAAAAWGGITLFRIEDGLLREGWAEEDYFARKRQLRSGSCDPIPAPMAAPWDAPCVAASADAEHAVRQWLADPQRLFGNEAEQVRIGGPDFAALVTPGEVKVSALFSAGARVAFHADVAGRYAGGFSDVARELQGAPATLRIAAIADVVAGDVARVQISADRLGLHRDLLGRERRP